MSVIHFDFEELGNVLACCVGSARETGTIECYAADLAVLSIANSAAYTRSYGDEAHESSVDELTAEAHHIIGTRKCRKDRALATVRMMSYNCFAQDGTDFIDKTPGAARAMIDLLNLFMRLAA